LTHRSSARSQLASGVDILSSSLLLSSSLSAHAILIAENEAEDSLSVYQEENWDPDNDSKVVVIVIRDGNAEPCESYHK
jgi:hypothetical protein